MSPSNPACSYTAQAPCMPPNGGASPRSSSRCPPTHSATPMATPLPRSTPAPHSPHPPLPRTLTRLPPLHMPCTPAVPRYPVFITPSVHYAQPANGYAHASVPKRFVHLVGSSLDVALDARGVGGRKGPVGAVRMRRHTLPPHGFVL
ncbi:hypothetical protein K438DRAFT_146289 [Mycena galopus ATCC 62051]|nr:hypothetical protein K438DRAFT_146289 [Mycena galopus ATCC 62051]